MNDHRSGLQRIVSGDERRRTRLHDEKGHAIALPRLLFHGPRALVSGLLRLTIGYRPARPWISYAAARVMRQFLSAQSRVLEFGSGMSTIWYARHARAVCAVEDFRPWYDRVQALLARRRLTNVEYVFASGEAEYAGFKTGDPHGFDLIVIDGSFRSACVRRALGLLRPGGMLYLDNSDKDSSPAGGDTRLAEQLVLDFATARDGRVTYFTDFAPTQLFVEQGLMLRLPPATDGHSSSAR